jgi:hypothetical protein
LKVSFTRLHHIKRCFESSTSAPQRVVHNSHPPSASTSVAISLLAIYFYTAIRQSLLWAGSSVSKWVRCPELPKISILHLMFLPEYLRYLPHRECPMWPR